MGGKKRKWLLTSGIFLAAVFWTAAGIWFVRSLSDKDRAAEQINDVKSLTLTSAKEKNSDTVGWIKIDGADVDYPFVQGRDNDYYKTHSFDKSHNSAGWIFLDSRNPADLSGSNNIIYLHGKLEGTEFAPVRSIIAKSFWMKEPENFVIRTSTDAGELEWQVFSIYKIPTTEDYLTVDFKHTADLVALAEKLKARSVYNFEVPFEESDKMLTFSIKYDNDYIVVIHGKLL